VFPRLGRSGADESLEVHGRAEGFHFEAGRRGVLVADIGRKAGISQATYFNWKKKFDGMTPPETRRLKQLEDENGKLRKLVADLSLDREMLQDVIRRKIYGLVASASSSKRVARGMGRVDPACLLGGLSEFPCMAGRLNDAVMP
jgi:putative transposase